MPRLHRIQSIEPLCWVLICSASCFLHLLRNISCGILLTFNWFYSIQWATALKPCFKNFPYFLKVLAGKVHRRHLFEDLALCSNCSVCSKWNALVARTQTMNMLQLWMREWLLSMLQPSIAKSCVLIILTCTGALTFDPWQYVCPSYSIILYPATLMSVNFSMHDELTNILISFEFLPGEAGCGRCDNPCEQCWGCQWHKVLGPPWWQDWPHLQGQHYCTLLGE